MQIPFLGICEAGLRLSDGADNRKGDVKTGFLEMDDDLHGLQFSLLNLVQSPVWAIETCGLGLLLGPLGWPSIKFSGSGIAQQHFHRLIVGSYRELLF